MTAPTSRRLHTTAECIQAGREDQAVTVMPVTTGERVAGLLSSALQENRTERDVSAA
jgi:hypothetical protein